jgi:hypothetical protein
MVGVDDLDELVGREVPSKPVLGIGAGPREDRWATLNGFGQRCGFQVGHAHRLAH